MPKNLDFNYDSSLPKSISYWHGSVLQTAGCHDQLTRIRSAYTTIYPAIRWRLLAHPTWTWGLMTKLRLWWLGIAWQLIRIWGSWTKVRLANRTTWWNNTIAVDNWVRTHRIKFWIEKINSTHNNHPVRLVPNTQLWLHRFACEVFQFWSCDITPQETVTVCSRFWPASPIS